MWGWQPQWRQIWAGLCLTLLLAGPGWTAPPAMLEIKTSSEKLQGKVVAHDKQHCWLVQQDGRLHCIEIQGVGKFKEVSPQFSSYSTSVMRDRLQREFGSGWEVVGTRRYIVCAQGEQRAKQFAEVFESQYRTVTHYFSVRGIKLNDPEFPLVAIIFPDHASFLSYSKSENVPTIRGLKGYYLTTSNRVALFDGDERPVGKSSPPPGSRASSPKIDAALFAPGNGSLFEPNRRETGTDPGSLLQTLLPPDVSVGDAPAAGSLDAREQNSIIRSAGFGPVNRENPHLHCGAYGNLWSSLQADLRDTMVHEATHQVAFNTGLHSRVGINPKWVVEGLATVFEAPGMRDSQVNNGPKSRMNSDRYVWFTDYSRKRRKQKSLEAFLSEDKMFETQTLDAYAEAWAFSFFLIETRPRDYVKYLSLIAQRDPLTGYEGKERIADFKKCFNGDLNMLESEFLRFLERVK